MVYYSLKEKYRYMHYFYIYRGKSGKKLRSGVSFWMVWSQVYLWVHPASMMVVVWVWWDGVGWNIISGKVTKSMIFQLAIINGDGFISCFCGLHIILPIIKWMINPTKAVWHYDKEVVKRMSLILAQRKKENWKVLQTGHHSWLSL